MNSNDNLNSCLKVLKRSEILEKSDFDDSFKEQYNNYLNIEDKDSEENLSSFNSSVSHVIIRTQVTSLKYEPEATGLKYPIKRLILYLLLLKILYFQMILIVILKKSNL